MGDGRLYETEHIFFSCRSHTHTGLCSIVHIHQASAGPVVHSELLDRRFRTQQVQFGGGVTALSLQLGPGILVPISITFELEVDLKNDM